MKSVVVEMMAVRLSKLVDEPWMQKEVEDLRKYNAMSEETLNQSNMSTIRAKFNVAEIARYGNAGGCKVTLFPVMGHSEENKAFWDATPSGKIEIHISNPNAVFEFGEYYVDFTKAE